MHLNFENRCFSKQVAEQAADYQKWAQEDIHTGNDIVEEVEEVIDPKKQLEMKIIELFQYINELGNYADSTWFSNLSRHMTVLMYL